MIGVRISFTRIGDVSHSGQLWHMNSSRHALHTALQSNPEPLQRESSRHHHAQRLSSESFRATKPQLVPCGSISFRLVFDECSPKLYFHIWFLLVFSVLTRLFKLTMKSK